MPQACGETSHPLRAFHRHEDVMSIHPASIPCNVVRRQEATRLPEIGLPSIHLRRSPIAATASRPSNIRRLSCAKASRQRSVSLAAIRPWKDWRLLPIPTLQPPMHSKSSVKAGSSSPRASSRSAFAMWKKRLGNMVLLSLMLKTVLVGPQSP